MPRNSEYFEDQSYLEEIIANLPPPPPPEAVALARQLYMEILRTNTGEDSPELQEATSVLMAALSPAKWLKLFIIGMQLQNPSSSNDPEQSAEQKELFIKYSQVLLGIDKDDEEYLIGEPYVGDYDWFSEDDTEEPYSEAEEDEDDDLNEEGYSYNNRVNGKTDPDLPRQLPLWPE